MTEKTMLEKIRSLAQAAINAEDDQEQFSNLMRIIELTETDNPTFAVGEYYSYQHLIFLVEEIEDDIVWMKEYDEKEKSIVYNVGFRLDTEKAKLSKPAAAEQIARFKRAEQFSKQGRKLDEFRVGDRAMDERGKVFTVTHITNGYLFNNTEIIDSVMKARLIKIMEDDNEI